MGGIFGKTKKQPSRVTEQDKAVLQLKQQRDKLKQYQRKIELSLEKDRLLAKKCLATGRKDRARMLLRKKKYQEKLLETTDQQLLNLEQLTSDLEFASVEQRVLDGLKTGNAALKKIHEILTVEEVERVLDETNEGIEKQREIDDILNSNAETALTAEDEEDVLAEIDQLIAAEEKATVAEDISEKEDVSLPDVPTDELPAAEKPIKTKKQKEAVPLEA